MPFYVPSKCCYARKSRLNLKLSNQQNFCTCSPFWPCNPGWPLSPLPPWSPLRPGGPTGPWAPGSPFEISPRMFGRYIGENLELSGLYSVLLKLIWKFKMDFWYQIRLREILLLIWGRFIIQIEQAWQANNVVQQQVLNLQTTYHIIGMFNWIKFVSSKIILQTNSKVFQTC